MEECGYYPTWVFGTSCDNEIEGTFRNGILNEFETKFVKEFYPEKTYTSFNESMKLQFYNKDCEIKLHDDGKPSNRICVFLFFLNTEWDAENGGHLILHTKDESTVKINPVFPNFVVLDSDINLFHEVEKVNKDMKYNIVSFYSGKF
jgi:Rps23 Pro-64 3,4-dihydroxylase Tpa1-like proline 4-hydroxylase